MPLGAYNSSFTVGASVAGFDVSRNGYGSDVEGNRTVREIPWAGTYSVVIQRGGIKALPRSYRVTFYLEADYIAMALLVNLPGGVLVTPREQAVAANLDKLSRGQSVDGNSTTGLTEATLTFTILQ